MKWNDIKTHLPVPGREYVIAYELKLGVNSDDNPKIISQGHFCCTEGWRINRQKMNPSEIVRFWAHLPEWPTLDIEGKLK